MIHLTYSYSYFYLISNSINISSNMIWFADSLYRDKKIRSIISYKSTNDIDLISPDIREDQPYNDPDGNEQIIEKVCERPQRFALHSWLTKAKCMIQYDYYQSQESHNSTKCSIIERRKNWEHG